jgi:hypothetical protein
MILPFLASLLLAVSAITDPSPIVIPADPLATLKTQHPRIMATASDFAQLRETLKTDPQASQMAQAVIRQADFDLSTEGEKYTQIPITPLSAW